MRHLYYSLLLLAIVSFASTEANAQVTIGANTPPQSFSVLELISGGNKGLRLPQMTSAEITTLENNADFIAEKTGKAMGLQVFNTDCKCVQTWNGATWLYRCGAIEFAFISGTPQQVDVCKPGIYRLEVWGAQGGNATDNANAPSRYGGHGGYSSGEVRLESGQKLYIYIGEQFSYMVVNQNYSFNGGGFTANGTYGSRRGGGASDIRLVGGAWDNAASLNSRILVAGGGGGSNNWEGHTGAKPTLSTGNIGHGGGLIGYTGEIVSNQVGGAPVLGGLNATTGGTQTAGGTATTVGTTSGNPVTPGQPGSFGKGGGSFDDGGGGGGGGGWYGGGGGAENTPAVSSGAGGSSFISGMTGCVAINPASITEPRAQKSGGNSAALSYSNALFGASPTWTDGTEIILNNAVMIDGAGYDWSTGTKSGAVVGMPMPDGTTGIGKTGHGFARITFVSE